MGVTRLGRGHWAEVYRLMVQGEFPNVPSSFLEAVPFFEDVVLLGVMDETNHWLSVVFVLGDITAESAFLDVVCAPAFRGKWAVRGVLQEIVRIAFEEMGLRFLWTQPLKKVSLKAALRAGFVPVTALDAAEPVLVLTPFGASGMRWSGAAAVSSGVVCVA